MTCQEVADFLMDYLDGALSTETRAVFDHHLGVCRECRDYLSSYETTVALARSSQCDADDQNAPPPPAELIAAILSSRRAEAPAAPPDGSLAAESNSDPK
ncbi:MAG: zf-HC2 domain-containing protein [Planctomycetes bacterium]|nr:zf-HC2 domain-containing protein [Planctomycetota bacterium]